MFEMNECSRLDTVKMPGHHQGADIDQRNSDHPLSASLHDKTSGHTIPNSTGQITMISTPMNYISAQNCKKSLLV